MQKTKAAKSGKSAEKAYLSFSSDRQEVTIHVNGKESLSLTSKAEVLEALMDYTANKKMSVGDMTRLRDEILEEKSLPYAPGPNIKVTMLHMGLEGLLFAALADFLSKSPKTFVKQDAKEKAVATATFVACHCPVKEKHGRIYFTNGCETLPFFDLKSGLEWLVAANERKFVPGGQKEFVAVAEQMKKFFGTNA